MSIFRWQLHKPPDKSFIPEALPPAYYREKGVNVTKHMTVSPEAITGAARLIARAASNSRALQRLEQVELLWDGKSVDRPKWWGMAAQPNEIVINRSVLAAASLPFGVFLLLHELGHLFDDQLRHMVEAVHEGRFSDARSLQPQAERFADRYATTLLEKARFSSDDPAFVELCTRCLEVPKGPHGRSEADIERLPLAASFRIKQDVEATLEQAKGWASSIGSTPHAYGAFYADIAREQALRAVSGEIEAPEKVGPYLLVWIHPQRAPRENYE